MPTQSPPALLRNLHCSLPTIVRLYKDIASSLNCPSREDSIKMLLPLEISTAADGEEVINFFCRELGMSVTSLRRWRCAVMSGMRRNWWRDCMRNKLAVVPTGTLSPNMDDFLFARSCITDLKAVISPFLTLAQPEAANAPRGSSFVATRNILPGVFLLSVPTSAIFFSSPPPATDPLTSFFMHVEDLVGQLVAVECSGDPPPSHAGYVDYLKKSVTPCNNLPFLEMGEVTQLLGKAKSSVGVTTGLEDTSSPALQLWEYFHRDMEGLPLSVFLRERLTKEEYAWWVSLVLSRRTGAATLIPVVDKLNHSPEPNCYYTMATEESFCGIDVFDNMLAGVDSELLYEPYLHTFSIREIKEGEELSLCYASPATNPKQRGVVGAPVSGGGDGISVATGEGRAAWQLQWGFIPSIDSPYTSADLLEVATIVAERRVDIRQKLFPP
ncbi:hypothetical protein, conserved [Trypanosoma brucei brucei TREU927]|uniref:SET domain-containing protein n=1 Tax=Trypanosoma brucei brucei (strain 927/4 GUTat10.1) TaxID=185431 RepID=Q388V8_TRYB2|nr:hypothetical protein, conserved [Trypanosoma brucei brucei TREU927]EAN78662.1 hypothetical protein, conserved [Trypanosoma brucei brucei TREU927]